MYMYTIHAITCFVGLHTNTIYVYHFLCICRRKIWVDALGSVIQSCTMAQSSSTYTECQSQSTFSVHVLNGTDLCLPSSSTRVYCEVGINGVTQRTVAVPGTTNTKWDCKVKL